MYVSKGSLIKQLKMKNSHKPKKTQLNKGKENSFLPDLTKADSATNMDQDSIYSLEDELPPTLVMETLAVTPSTVLEELDPGSSPKMPRLFREIDVQASNEEPPGRQRLLRTNWSARTDESGYEMFPTPCKIPSSGQYNMPTPNRIGHWPMNFDTNNEDLNLTMPPMMPQLEPEIQQQQRSQASVCRILFKKRSSSSSSGKSNWTIYTPVTAPLQDMQSSSTTSSSRNSISDDVKAGVKVRKAYSKLPVGGQISLRAYYYGRWNWGEESAKEPKLLTGRNTRNHKNHFEAEFTRFKGWMSLMDTLVPCTLCPDKLGKNTDVLPHMMEHVKQDSNEKWELLPLASVPKMENCKNQCRLCFSKCPSLLGSHMKEIHQHVTDISCRICELRFDSTELMILHHSKFHEVAEMPFCCPICDCRSSFRWDIIRHFQIQHGTLQSVLCTFCMKLFPVDSAIKITMLQNHLLAHKAEPELNCVRCCLKFVAKEDLMMHMNGHHGQNPQMRGEMFFDKLRGYQCFQEDAKRRPIFIDHPNRPNKINPTL